MITERMALILSRYVDKRTATQQLLSAIRNNRKKGFELINTIHNQPYETQLIWSSRLLLDNSGVAFGSNDIPDEEFNNALTQAFRDRHSIYEDATLFLSSVTPFNRMKG